MGMLAFELYDFHVRIFYFIPMSDNAMNKSNPEGGGERLGTWPANGAAYRMTAADHRCIAKGPRLRHDGKWLDRN